MHYNDPLAIRIEPLLCKEFAKIEPCKICSYSSSPYGDDLKTYLDYYLLKHQELLQNSNQITSDEKESFKLISKSMKNYLNFHSNFIISKFKNGGV